MMNLNLKKTSQILFFLLILQNSYGQKNSNLELYGSVGAVFNGSFNSSTSNEMANKYQTFKQYQDSAGTKETWRLNFSPQIGIIYQINRDFDIQLGVSYIVLGHQRKLKDLKYKDITYPGIGNSIGVIEENTNVTRNINLNYRYHYLQIPFMVNYKINAKGNNNALKATICAGMGLNFLLKHDMNAQLLDGYKIDGKSSFQIDSTGYQANTFSANLLIGSRIDYSYSKQIKLFCQPMIGIFPLAVSSTQLEARPWFININFGAIVTTAIFKSKLIK